MFVLRGVVLCCLASLSLAPSLVLSVYFPWCFLSEDVYADDDVVAGRFGSMNGEKEKERK